MTFNSSNPQPTNSGIFDRPWLALALLMFVFSTLDVAAAVFGPTHFLETGPFVVALGVFCQPIVLAAWWIGGRSL